MSWNLIGKISSSIIRGRIVTPDLNQILVGASEDLVLIYQATSSRWNSKEKPVGNWSKEAKN